MAVVTALWAARAGRVCVHVDGRAFCTASEALVARLRLFKGLELDEQALQHLREDASAEVVLSDAYRLLGHRMRSTQEVRRRLLQKGHTAAAVEATLVTLGDEGFLDDAEFARRYAADKRSLAGWGEARVRRGLQALGIEPDAVEAALRQTGDADTPPGADEGGDAELERAVAVLARKGAPSAPLDAARRRAYQTLLRRGFAPETAYAAVRRWAHSAAAQGDAESTM